MPIVVPPVQRRRQPKRPAAVIFKIRVKQISKMIKKYEKIAKTETRLKNAIKRAKTALVRSL